MFSCILNLLAERPWGSRDFRVIDPNGYYIRINELSTRESHARHMN